MRGIKEIIGLYCWLNNEHEDLMAKVMSKKPSPNQDRLHKLQKLDLSPRASHGLTEQSGPSVSPARFSER